MVAAAFKLRVAGGQAQQACQVTARRRPGRGDGVRGDAPRRGVGPHKADRSLGVVQLAGEDVPRDQPVVHRDHRQAVAHHPAHRAVVFRARSPAPVVEVDHRRHVIVELRAVDI